MPLKRSVFTMAVICLFFLMLIFPSYVLSGASRGLALWFGTVLPTLLPFMIVANLIIRTNGIHLIAFVFGRVLRKCLHVSECGAFAVIAGFLCGYPMGAKVTGDLLKEDKISFEEADYLLSFCNNTSPVFIISYVAGQKIRTPSLIVPSIVILFLSPLLCSRIFYAMKTRGHKKSAGKTDGYKNLENGKRNSFSMDVLDTCMMDGFVSITKVGGYMMLFSILMELSLAFPAAGSDRMICLCSFLEITTGVSLLSDLSFGLWSKWILIMSLTSFGGFCAAAQTYGMIRDSGLKIATYIKEKLVTSAVTSLLCMIYLCVC